LVLTTYLQNLAPVGFDKLRRRLADSWFYLAFWPFYLSDLGDHLGESS